MIGNITKAVQRILNRKHAYRAVFMDASGDISRNGEIVLADLRKFCRANSTTVMVSPISKSIDPIAMAMAEGRREVWLRLMAHLHIDEKQVFNLEEPDNGNQ
jgi:hypothetical protein